MQAVQEENVNTHTYASSIIVILRIRHVNVNRCKEITEHGQLDVNRGRREPSRDRARVSASERQTNRHTGPG